MHVTEEDLALTRTGKVTVLGEEFDAVILACGYGVETEFDTISYWRDEDLEGHKGICLVSGYGDGAVTDLMRLCIRNFYHGDILEKFTSPEVESVVAQKLLKAEQEYRQGDDLSVVYRNAASESGISTLKRDGTTVHVNCTHEQLFSPRSSILNRLIVAHLLNRGAFDFQPHSCQIADEKRLPNGQREVMFQDGSTETYDHVILRHGVKKTAVLPRDFPKIWAATADLRAAWETTRQGTDWTRKPLYRDDDFRPTGPRRPMRVDFGGNIGCLVLDTGRQRTGDDLAALVRHTLKRIKKSRAFEMSGRELELQPEVIHLTNAVASVEAYARTIRALCDSELLIADISDFNPVAMLLLGVRAVARRGVTVTVTYEQMLDASKPLIPFNLLELNPLSLHGKDAAVIKALEESLTQGFTQYHALPDRYLDLPAYDAVRQLGGSPEQYKPISPDQKILMLSWFSPHYLNICGQTLLNSIDTEFGPDKAVRTIDTSSPQLVGQRLYALIRRTRLCFADWTGWRPNVLFETGVRLAVNEEDPILVVYTDSSPPAFELKGVDAKLFTRRYDEGAALAALFVPLQYDKSEASSDRLASRLEAVRQANDSSDKLRNPHAKVSPGLTYRLVRDERLGASAPTDLQPVCRLLSASADAMIGPPFEGTVPYLYAQGNTKLLSRIRSEAIERLLAAIYYLERRYDVRERVKKQAIAFDDPLMREYEQLLSRTLDTLRNQPGDAYADVLSDLMDAIAAVESLPRSSP